MDWICMSNIIDLAKQRKHALPCTASRREFRKLFGDGTVRVTQRNIQQFVDGWGGRTWSAQFISGYTPKYIQEEVALYLDPDKKRLWRDETKWCGTTYFYVPTGKKEVNPAALTSHIRRLPRERIVKALYQVLKRM